MSKYEERAYQVGRSKPNIAGLKNQLTRLKHDLDQFVARKPSGSVVVTLKERIRELEATIAEAEANRKRESQAASSVAEEAAEGDAATAQTKAASRTASYTTSSRFPPRGRPGR